MRRTTVYLAKSRSGSGLCDCRMASSRCASTTCKSCACCKLLRNRPPRFTSCGVSMFTKSRQFASPISRANKYAEIPEGGGEPSDDISLMTNMFHQHFLVSQPSSRRVATTSPPLPPLCAPGNSSACSTHPRSPFDQSHSRLIRPSFTLNRSNYPTD